MLAEKCSNFDEAGARQNATAGLGNIILRGESEGRRYWSAERRSNKSLYGTIFHTDTTRYLTPK